MTVGHVVFAAIDRWVPERVTYRVLPFVLAGTFALIALLPDDTPCLGVLAFGLAGLGCSALLPLTIGFAQELATVAAAAAGGISRSTSSGTASPRSGSARSSTRASPSPRSTRLPRASPSPWGCCPSRWPALGSRSQPEFPLRQQVRYTSRRAGHHNRVLRRGKDRHGQGKPRERSELR